MLNSCDESGDGINDAECDNDAVNFIGPVVQTNTATGADESDTVVQSNGAQVTQNSPSLNDCDEENTGDNLAVCYNEDGLNSIFSITQTNDCFSR